MSRDFFFFHANPQRSAKIFILNKNGTNNLTQEQEKSKENPEINFVTQILLATSVSHHSN